jgi:hypothetical protein
MLCACAAGDVSQKVASGEIFSVQYREVGSFLMSAFRG